MADVNRRIILASRPKGEPSPENFSLVQEPVPVPGPGEMLLRAIWLSLDPYQRGRMNAGTSYAPPVNLGEVMVGGTVSLVLKSHNPDFQAGDYVVGRTGWQDYACSTGTGLRKLDPTLAPLSTGLGVLGMPGMTAYTGLQNIGQPKTGETLVVAAASGAVGALVGQIARIYGARPVGIAGGREKCAYVVRELGFDACLDHRSPDFAASLAAACPDGIDIYFENVGGAIFDAVWPLLNNFARIPICGLISQYNAETIFKSSIATPGLLTALLTKRLTLRGFINSDFAYQEQEFLAAMAGWLRDGRIKYREDIVPEFEAAPEAFIGLLRGRNFGKLLVVMSPEPSLDAAR